MTVLKSQEPTRYIKHVLRIGAAWCLVLVLCSSATWAKGFTVNPVGKWTAVLAEFRIPRDRAVAGNPGPPFTRISSKFPTIPSVWEDLKHMVRIRLRGSLWSDDEPVISGWRPWADDRGASGIEIQRSDERPEAILFPVIAVERGGPVPVHWSIQIWGRSRFEDHPELLPGDPEYQNLIKQKIQVDNFSLVVHKVEGGVGLENIRKDALAEPSETIGKYLGWGNSLAAYEAQKYSFPARANYVGELRFKMELSFPEAAKEEVTTYPARIGASLRFMCGSRVNFRVISDKLRRGALTKSDWDKE